MNGNANEASVEALIEQYLDGGRRLDLDDLDEGRRTEVARLLTVADLLWREAHRAPALADDPVAAMLGLVPDPSQVLDSSRLKRAMTAAQLGPAQLAARLEERGWRVTPQDVFSWTTKNGGTDVSPALIRALAEETRSSPDQLSSSTGESAHQTTVREVTQTAVFQQLAQRWAQLHRVSIDGARQALASRLPRTVHRGDVPDAEQMLRSLEALVEALDEDGESPREP